MSATPPTGSPAGSTWTGDLAPEEHALRVRELIVEMCGSAEGGHLGGSMSLVEILVTLYRSVLRIDPAAPDDPERDMLLLSKGHGAIGLYAALAERGFFPAEDLATYGRPESLFSAHPNPAVPGVEMPTGSLGHGLPLGVGFALAARLDASPRRTFVLLGDGELQEGSNWEAAMAAGSLGLGRLVAVVDRNSLQITGPTENAVALEPLADRWHSFGWNVHEVDGHDIALLRATLDGIPYDADRPTVLIARTVKGRGLPYIEGQARSHYARLGERPKKRALAILRAQSRKAAQA
ncbi:transketolase [Streptomyces olivoreticuli]